ncbi:MAG TPA: RusA family crossover junction endodeoxyribonuclease [Vulgatibacter sp.]
MRHAFHVPGLPQPKGSTRSFKHRTTGRIVTRADNAESLEPWQTAIGWRAKAAGVRLSRGPVEIDCTFIFARPKGHFGARGLLRPSAPERHLVKPDADKLLRAVLDALTKIAYVDDAQVVSAWACKRYATEGEAPGVAIEVYAP